MKPKIRVHGKSQSRTALGIINAYLKLNPDATPYDVQQAFPASLNRRCPSENLIIPEKETLGHEKMFFEQQDEQVVFKNGERYALVEVWSKEDFNSICEHAKQYGIESAKEGSKPFERGSYELEYLDKRRFKWWWILLLILLLLLLIFFCWKKCCNKCSQTEVATTEIVEQPTNPIDDQESPIKDYENSISVTFPDGNVMNIDKNSSEYLLFSFLNCPETQVDEDRTKGWIPMNDLTFETGSAELLAESDNQLNNIALIMRFFPDAHIRIGGYTDDTGTDKINLKLSKDRAKTTFEKLVSLGVEEDRITYEGYSSFYPVSTNDSDEAKAANRRVDIRVTKK